MDNQDFSKKRRNRYSIRKMTAGAASVIVGITLFANANDAQAAEQINNGDTKAQTTTSTTETSEQTVGKQGGQSTPNEADQQEVKQGTTTPKDSENQADSVSKQSEENSNNARGNEVQGQTNQPQAANEDATKQQSPLEGQTTGVQGNEKLDSKNTEQSVKSEDVASNQDSEQPKTNNQLNGQQEQAENNQPSEPQNDATKGEQEQAENNQPSEPQNDATKGEQEQSKTVPKQQKRVENTQQQSSQQSQPQSTEGSDDQTKPTGQRPVTGNAQGNKEVQHTEQAPVNAQEKPAVKKDDTTDADKIKPTEEQVKAPQTKGSEAVGLNNPEPFSAPVDETTHAPAEQNPVGQEPGRKAVEGTQAPVNKGAEADVPNDDTSFDPNGSTVTDANNPTLGNVETNGENFEDTSDAAKDFSNKKDGAQPLATPPRVVSRLSKSGQTGTTTKNPDAKTYAMALDSNNDNVTEPETSGADNNAASSGKTSDVTTQAAPTGTNVDNLVTASNYRLSNKTVQANDSQGTDMSVDLKVDNSVKSGDYFTVKFPKYLNYFGNSTPQSTRVPDLMNGNQVVASGAFNEEDNSLTYTFTDYVNNHDNVTGKFNLPLWADRKNALNSGNYPITTTVAGEKFTDNVDINYRVAKSPAQSNIDSFITKTDQATGDYTQTIYVNPEGKVAYHTKVNLYNYWPGENMPSDSSAQLNPNVTNFKIYEVKTNEPLNTTFMWMKKIRT